jgi:cbb3-type cytochrome c oxidase subunit III
MHERVRSLSLSCSDRLRRSPAVLEVLTRGARDADIAPGDMRIAAASIVSIALIAALPSCRREERNFAPLGPSYTESAYAVSEGKELFDAMNCSGCHAHGGGALGPALTDGSWRYGRDPASVEESIRMGRPRGMPAFEHRVSPDDIPKLVVYVRSLSGLVRSDAVSARDEHMQSTPSPALEHHAIPVPGVER